MTTAVSALPLLGLRVRAGPVELRGITDDLLGPLADLVVAGIHAPDLMPFSAPWTAVPAHELPRNFAQHHWRVRASFAPEKWSAEFAVFWNGELTGVQGISTENYLILRGGETGSWLGRAFQGKGIGTAMRQVMCAFVFDHLDGAYITSGAFTDNPASLAVSRKTGYADNGVAHLSRQGRPATLRKVLLTPDRLVRFGHDLTVDGLPAFRRSIGLDA